MRQVTSIQPRLEAGSIECAYSWWIAAMALMAASLSFGALMSVPVLLKPLSKEWQVGAAPISLAFTAAMVGTAIGSLTFGRIVDRVKFFRVGLCAAFGAGTGLVLAAHAERLSVLWIAYGVFVGGVGQGGLFSPLTAAVAQWFDRHRPFAIALVACGQCVGGLLFPPLLRWGADEFGWRSTLQFFGICACAIIVVCLLAFRRSPPAPRPAAAAREEGAAGMKRCVFAGFGMCMFLFNYAAFTAMGHLTAYAEELGVAPQWAASFMSATLGAALISRLLIGFLSRRFGTLRTLFHMAAVHTLGATILAGTVGSIQGSVVAALLIGIGFGGYLPAFAIVVRERFPATAAGRRISEIYCFGFCAAGLGSVSAGWMRDATNGYRLPFLVGALAAWGGLVLLSSVRRSLVREPAPTAMSGMPAPRRAIDQ
jgi:MFS family permease